MAIIVAIYGFENLLIIAISINKAKISQAYKFKLNDNSLFNIN